MFISQGHMPDQMVAVDRVTQKVKIGFLIQFQILVTFDVPAKVDC